MAVTLSGLAIGAAVIVNGTNSIPAWDKVVNQEVTIELLYDTRLIAPAGVRANVVMAGLTAVDPVDNSGWDETLHDAITTITYGDAGSTFAAVAGHVMPHATDANVTFGRFGAHVYEQAGTYQILAEVVWEGQSYFAHTEIVVADPGQFFGGNRTICVSSSSSFGAAPAGSQQVTSFAAATAAATALGEPCRFLFYAGDEFTVDEYAPAYPDMIAPRMGAYGDIATLGRPILNVAMTAQNCISHNTIDPTSPWGVTLSDIVIQGPWDVDTESPQIGNAPPGGAAMNGARVYTVHNVKIRGIGVGIGMNAADGDKAVLIVTGCDIREWQDFGVYAGAASLAEVYLIGNLIAQGVLALSGGGGKNNEVPRNWHSSIRLQNILYAYVAKCRLFGRNNWGDTLPMTGDPGANPPLRAHCTGVNGRTILSDNVVEGGGACIARAQVNGAGDKEPNNCLIENNIVVSTAQTKSILTIDYGLITVRSNLFIATNTTGVGVVCGTMVVADAEDPSGAYTSSAANRASPVEVYGNTFLNLKNDANDDGTAGVVTALNKGGAFTAFSSENNLTYEPNITGGDVAAAPMGLTVLTAPMFLGIRYQEAPTLDAAQASPPDTISLPRPAAGSSAIGTVTSGKVPYHYLDRTVRPATSDLGALPPTGA